MYPLQDKKAKSAIAHENYTEEADLCDVVRQRVSNLLQLPKGRCYVRQVQRARRYQSRERVSFPNAVPFGMLGANFLTCC